MLKPVNIALLLIVVIGGGIGIVAKINQQTPKQDNIATKTQKEEPFQPTPDIQGNITSPENLGKTPKGANKKVTDWANEIVNEDLLKDIDRTVSKEIQTLEERAITNDLSKVGIDLLASYADAPQYNSQKENLYHEVEQNYSDTDLQNIGFLSEVLYDLLDKFFENGQFKSDEAIHFGYLARAIVEKSFEFKSNQNSIEFLELASQVYQTLILLTPGESYFNNPEALGKIKNRFVENVGDFIMIREKSHKLLTQSQPLSALHKDLLFEVRFDLAVAYEKIGERDKSQEMFEGLLADLSYAPSKISKKAKGTLEKAYEKFLNGGSITFAPFYMALDLKRWPMKKDVQYFHRFPSFRGDRQRIKYLVCQYKK